MANIVGTNNMNENELRSEIANGGRFVQYIWCISLLLITFKRSSDIYFIRADESATKKGLSYSFLTLILGWWGIPWGPIYSLQCLGRNLSGGYDLTDGILKSMQSFQENDAAVYQDVTVAPVLESEPAQAATNSEIKPQVPMRRNRSGPVIRR